jgi:hypothetical protein
MPLQRIPPRQIDIGEASYFTALAETPPANQVTVKAGSLVRAGMSVLQNALYPADQPTAGFAVVTPGFQRYDLVALDATGAATVIPGYEVTIASPAFQGAPGWVGTNPGIQIPDNLVPVAYVLVDETATVEVSDSDITPVGGRFSMQRSYDGYLVDKGLFGSAPAGASDDVSTLFASDTRIDSSGATVPDSGGSSTQTGCVTAPPENYVHLVDQAGDEINHTTGARMYGRLTEAAGVWTLTYFYLDGAGTETSMDPSADTAGPAPTDLRLVGVPCIFSRNDPNRPLFDSNVARLSDQLVGTIPDGTETVKGKVEFAPNLGTTALEAVQASDARVGAVRGRRNADAVSTHEDVVRLIEGANITIGLVQAAGELQFTISAAAGGGPQPPQGASGLVSTAGANFNPSFSNYAIFLMAVGNCIAPGTDQNISIGGAIGANASHAIVAQGCVYVDAIGGTEVDGFTDGQVLVRADVPAQSFMTVTTMSNTSIILTKGGTVPTQGWTGRVFAIGY